MREENGRKTKGEYRGKKQEKGMREDMRKSKTNGRRVRHLKDRNNARE